MKKLKVAVLFGGQSAEHEISLQSAKNIIEALDRDKYEISLVGIDKEGRWHLNSNSEFLLNATNPKLIKLNQANALPTTIAPGSQELQLLGNGPNRSVDVVLPVLHGTMGEDGTVQGLLTLANLPFVGPGVLGSAVGMDKDVMKRLLRDADLPIAKFLTVRRCEEAKIKYDEVTAALGSPVFIKPANMGSSVGVSKVSNAQEFAVACRNAFEFDEKILIEEAIVGREIEVAILGNEEPLASVPGEIVPHHNFYSYEAKYIDEKGAELIIPADLPPEVAAEVQDIAKKTFVALCCEGLSRVDMFVTKDYRIYVNEINTLPGFTKISMYPKLWGASGVPYSELLDRLIALAIKRHERQSKLKLSYR